MRCPGERALCDATYLLSSPSVSPGLFQSDQRSRYSEGAAVFKIVSQHNLLSPQNIVTITLRANATNQNFLGGGEKTCFQAILCTLLSACHFVTID